MKAQKTIKEMMTELLLDAAAKNNKEINFGECAYIAENMRHFFYRWYIVDDYRKFIAGKDSREILQSLSENLHLRYQATAEYMARCINKTVLN